MRNFLFSLAGIASGSDRACLPGLYQIGERRLPFALEMTVDKSGGPLLLFRRHDDSGECMAAPLTDMIRALMTGKTASPAEQGGGKKEETVKATEALGNLAQNAVDG